MRSLRESAPRYFLHTTGYGNFLRTKHTVDYVLYTVLYPKNADSKFKSEIFSAEILQTKHQHWYVYTDSRCQSALELGLG